MNRALMIALMVVSAGTAGLVRAQPVPGGAVGASAETLLHLSAEGAVQAAPDQLVAALLAQATAASAAEAQRRANALVAQGLQAARSVPAVEARAIGYGVSPADEKRTQWTAQQTLELRGGDGPALLDLTNRLQQLGFVTESLAWQLSPGLRRNAFREATTAALKALQEQAASAAATLGLKVDRIKDVQLLPEEGRPFRPMMAMAARVSAPAPQATASPEDVTAQVSAEVVLRR